MKRLSLALLLLVACGGPSKTDVVPRLPSDGTGNFGDDKAKAGAGEADPWAGRDLIEAPAPQKPAAIGLPETVRFTLKNGLQVIVVSSNQLPAVAMKLAIKAGGRDATREKVGLATFTAQMLTKGTRRRSAEKIAKDIDSVGGSLSAQAAHEASTVFCGGLSTVLPTCLSLVSEVVISPSFPADKMKEVDQGLRAVVRQRADDAGQLAGIHFQNQLWGDGHVRGWPMTNWTLDSIARKDLVAWHRKYYVPNNAILSVAGDVDPVKLKRDLERAFGRWRKGKVPARKKYAEAPISDVIRVVDKADQTQSHIRIGQYGISHVDEDFYATTVFNYSLGGGAFASRLMKVVRSEAGKTYGARSSFDRNLERGAFAASTFTRTAETVATIKLVIGELEKMAKDGPTESEVSDAIANIAGRYSTRFESAADVAEALLGAELHGFGDDYVKNYALNIASVTVGNARAAAAKHLSPKKLAITIVGNAAEIVPQLVKEGWKHQIVGHLEPITAYEREAITKELMKPADPKKVAAAKAVLEKALKKKGGPAKLKAIKSLSWEADAIVSVQGQTIPATASKQFVAPNKVRTDLLIQGGLMKMSTAVTEKGGWAIQKTPKGTQEIELPSTEVKAVQEQLWRDPEFVLLRHREKGAVIFPLPEMKVDGRSLHLIRVTAADGEKSVVMAIDAKSSLLVGLSYSEQGLKTEESLGDYKKVKGVNVAHKREKKSAQMDLVITLTKFEVNPSLSKNIFDKPKPEK